MRNKISIYRIPENYDNDNSILLKCLEKSPTSHLVQDILRKIKTLLYLEKRSNREAEFTTVYSPKIFNSFLSESFLEFLSLTLP